MIGQRTTAAAISARERGIAAVLQRGTNLRWPIMLLGGSQVCLVSGFVACVGHLSPPVEVKAHRRPPRKDDRQCAIDSRTLTVAVGRVPMQRFFKLCRSRRSFEVARQNLTIRCVVTVKFPVRFLIRTKGRALQRDAREQPA